MATRLYPTPASTPALTPGSWSAGWNKTTGTVNRELSPTPRYVTATDGNTNTASGTSGHFTAVARCVSPPLFGDQTISGTLKGQFKCIETAAGDNYTVAVAVKVIKPDGTDRGVVLAVSASDNTAATPPEMATAADTNRGLQDSSENKSITLSSVSAISGDRIVVEFGYRQASTSTNVGVVDFGDSNGADLPEDDTSTSALNAWVEFSGNLAFAPYYYGSASTPVDSASATGAADPTAVTPPSGMLSGDLVCMIGQQRVTGATLAISAAGGQTWTSETGIGITLQSVRLFWCIFNGTWSADPSVDFSASTCNSVQMHVFRPASTAYTWVVNQAQVELDDATDPFTITGQTTTGASPTVTFAGWFSADDNTWGTLSGTDWISIGTAQYRNTSGSDQSASYACKVQIAAAATGNVSKSQLTLGADASTTFIISFEANSAAKVLVAEAGSYSITGTATTLRRNLPLVADAGSYAITGTTATLRRNLPLVASAGSYSIAGTNASLLHRWKLAAGVGSYIITGADASLNKGQRLIAGAGSYDLTGTDASIFHNWKLAAAAGSYALTGTNATLTRNLPLIAGAGSYAVAGTDASLLHKWVLAAAAGSYAVTGTNASVLHGWKLAAGAGAYTITGTDASLTITAATNNKTLAADAGTYTISGTAASILHQWKLAAAAGSYALTGTNASLLHNWKLAAGAGAYNLTGTNASLLHGWKIVAGAGSYAITGAAATLSHQWRLSAGGGAYTINGQAASLLHQWKLTPAAGSYVITGTDAALIASANKTLAADAGSYAITGGAATLSQLRKVIAESGIYLISGADADLTIAAPGSATNSGVQRLRSADYYREVQRKQALQVQQIQLRERQREAEAQRKSAEELRKAGETQRRESRNEGTLLPNPALDARIAFLARELAEVSGALEQTKAEIARFEAAEAQEARELAMRLDDDEAILILAASI